MGNLLCVSAFTVDSSPLLLRLMGLLKKMRRWRQSRKDSVEIKQSPPVSVNFKQYDQDNLRTSNNHDFMKERRFVKAYERGVQSSGVDYCWHWRVHVGLWAASTASSLQGDFVECGVGNGFLASAILDYLDWNHLSKSKKMVLMDTFCGIDGKYLTKEEIQLKGDAATQNEAYKKAGVYASSVDAVRENFSQWERVEIIAGSIPETLPEADVNRIAFLHIDMNCIPPEIAAFRHFWPMLVDGGILLLDDYAYFDHTLQKEAMDAELEIVNHSILSLPTGQGLVIKRNA